MICITFPFLQIFDRKKLCRQNSNRHTFLLQIDLNYLCLPFSRFFVRNCRKGVWERNSPLIMFQTQVGLRMMQETRERSLLKYFYWRIQLCFLPLILQRFYSIFTIAHYTINLSQWSILVGFRSKGSFRLSTGTILVSNIRRVWRGFRFLHYAMICFGFLFFFLMTVTLMHKHARNAAKSYFTCLFDLKLWDEIFIFR